MITQAVVNIIVPEIITINQPITIQAISDMPNASYSWSVTPEGPTFGDTASKITTITFNTAGQYLISCYVEIQT